MFFKSNFLGGGLVYQLPILEASRLDLEERV